MTGARFDPDYDPAELVGTGRYLTKQELFTWTRFLDASRLLEESLARHVARDHDMTHSDYEILVRLDGAGGSMRMTQLAEQAVSSAQKLTHTANRLEKRGWIKRVPADDDGRGLLATLTGPGRATLAAAAEGHAAMIKRFLLDDMTDQEQIAIGDVMARLSAHLRIHRSGEICPTCTGDESVEAD